MEYRVELTPRAEHDLAHLYLSIQAKQSASAAKWYRGIKKAIFSLESNPNRCSVTPENRKLRHLLYGSRLRLYRVIYRVSEKDKQVQILHVRHGARQGFSGSDLA